MIAAMIVNDTPIGPANAPGSRSLFLRWLFPGLTLTVSALALPATASAPDQAQEPSPVERGEYLVHAAGCVTCHTKDTEGAIPFAGGRALHTRFGTFYTPNITPDPATGIGRWSQQEFVRALKHGISPAGKPYYPAFPYTFYAGMTDADARAIYAYLQSLDPVHNEVPAHDLEFPFNIRMLLWGWRWLFFDTGSFEFKSNASERWQRGAYLVRHLAHCGACHTPRNILGAVKQGRHLAGNAHGPEGNPVPNITPSDDGIGDWSTVDISFFLFTGFLPNGDVVGGGMNAVIQGSTSNLTKADRKAIAVYLQNIPPEPSPAGLED